MIKHILDWIDFGPEEKKIKYFLYLAPMKPLKIEEVNSSIWLLTIP